MEERDGQLGLDTHQWAFLSEVGLRRLLFLGVSSQDQSLGSAGPVWGTSPGMTPWQLPAWPSFPEEQPFFLKGELSHLLSAGSALVSTRRWRFRPHVQGRDSKTQEPRMDFWAFMNP